MFLKCALLHAQEFMEGAGERGVLVVATGTVATLGEHNRCAGAATCLYGHWHGAVHAWGLY